MEIKAYPPGKKSISTHDDRSLTALALAPNVRTLGWNLPGLKALARVSCIIANNFEQLTLGQARFRVRLTDRNDAAAGETQPVINVRESCIDVQICHTPERTFRELPIELSQALVDLLWQTDELGNKLIPGLAINVDIPEALANDFIDNILTYFSETRGVLLDEGLFRYSFFSWMTALGPNMIKQRFAFELLRSCPAPNKLIAKEIAEQLISLVEQVIGCRKRWDDPSPVGLIAQLAAFSLIAGKIGRRDLELRVLSQLLDDPGRQMAYWEFLRLCLDTGHYQRYPIKTRLQLDKAVEGMLYIYDSFRLLLDQYFNTARVVKI